MPDASGTPSTNYLIPKFNTAVDPPSGKGTNTIVDFLDNLLKTTFVNKPSGISVNGVPIWNGTTWVQPSGTPSSATVLKGDGSWGTAAGAPTGAVTAYAATTAPSGWSLLDGAARKRSGADPGDSQDYSALFALISTTYGVGDGSTTFNLPDMRGRNPVGKGTNADVSALGNNDGSALANRSPRHRHTVGTDSPDHTHGIQAGGGNDASGFIKYKSLTSDGIVENTAGASARHSHSVGPGAGTEPLDSSAYLVLNYIIKL